MTTDILPVAGPATHVPRPARGYWSVADYATLPDDGLRYEIVNGELQMAPAPNINHQATSGILFYHLMREVYITGAGRVFAAPVDVELSAQTLVQPDIVVVLQNGLAAITEQRIVGTPDLVVEIASPSTASYDRREKHDTYAGAGVREYWIVDPDSRSIELLILEEARFRLEHVYRGQAILPSLVIPTWDVMTAQLFG